MRKLLVLFALLNTTITVHAGDWDVPAKRENFHIFLLMGKSNMVGSAKTEPGDEKPVPGVLVIPTVTVGEHAWQPAAHPLHNRSQSDNRFGLGLPFAIEYRRTHPGVTVGLIPVAVGGTPIDGLRKGRPVYADALAKAKWAAQQGVISGVLWHQGESDTFKKELSDAYAGKLDQLVRDIRADLELPLLPFVAGQLGEFYGTSSEHNTPDRLERIQAVQNILRELPRRMPQTAWVPSKDLKSKGDQVHFDRTAYMELGKRYADALATIKSE